MQSKFKFLAVVLGFVSIMFCSCKGDKATNSVIDEDLAGDFTKVELPEGFSTFLYQFSTDSAFQIQHIVWPLDVQPAQLDIAEETKLEKRTQEEWKLQHAFDAMNDTYTQDFVVFSGIVTENVKDKSGQYTMTRRFSKIGDEWMLIFYKEMGL